MLQILQTGQIVRTQASSLDCEVGPLLGGGGQGEVYRATADDPLEVPENAVVVPGSRAVKEERGPWKWNLSLYTPVIVKYRDEKTDKGIELEDWLR